MSMAMRPQFDAYDSQSFYDEMFDSEMSVRSHYEGVYRTFARMKPPELAALPATCREIERRHGTVDA